MIYGEWEPFYREILKDLNLKHKKDVIAAEVLDDLLSIQRNICSKEKISDLIKDREVLIFGAGPSLLNAIEEHMSSSFFKKALKISADGTTSALIQKQLLPDMITTDLDGKISDQIDANKKGSIVVIHAHGDNIKKLKKFVPYFKGPVFGTTQVDPILYDHLYNYGGFTDGDRALFLADHFNAKKIYLIGFDFNGEIGEYSFADKKNKKLKLKKLLWCHLLIAKMKVNKPGREIVEL